MTGSTCVSKLKLEAEHVDGTLNTLARSQCLDWLQCRPPPTTALNVIKKSKVVWEVLKALRAHDDRFETLIHKIDPVKNANKTIDVIGTGGEGADNGPDGKTDPVATEALFTMAIAAEQDNAVFARMAKKDRGPQLKEKLGQR